MDNADRIIRMLSDADFIRDHWMQAPKIFQAGRQFHSIRTQYPLEAWIRAGVRFLPESMQFLKNGNHFRLQDIFPPEQYPDPTDLVLDRARRYTLAIYGIDAINSFYGDICQGLGTRFESLISAGMFVSLGKSPGLKKHRDAKHMFIFQHTECSLLRVYSPLDGKPVMEHELLPGEIAHIPLCFEHELERLSEGESHVSTAFEYPSFTYLLMTMKVNPLFRSVIDTNRGSWRTKTIMAAVAKAEEMYKLTTEAEEIARQ